MSFQDSFVVMLREKTSCYHRMFSLEFPTNRLEMNAVADIFDKDRDGFIDYKEFINALRPDREVCQSLKIFDFDFFGYL